LYEGFSVGVRWGVTPWVTWTFANIIHYIPLFLRKALIWAAGHADTDEIMLVAEDHLDYYVVHNILTMAAEEAVEVREMKSRHLNQIRKNENDVFIFSQIDHYVPLSYVEDLRKDVPEAKIIIADKVIVFFFVCFIRYYFILQEVEHAFVLRHSEYMAEKVLANL
jgi:hypothetical protein